jgi:hypothetical protein
LSSVPQFLYGTMVAALNKEFGVAGVGATSSDAAPVTFQDLVDRIKSVIAQFDPATSSAAADAGTRVRNALLQAVHDAKDVLSHYGKLDADTEQQINDAVAAILAPPADSTSAAPSATAEPVAADRSSVVTATYASIERSQSTSIQIKTRDGDIVTIDLSRQSGASTTTAAYGANSGVQLSTGYTSSQLNFSVQGDLSEDERHAIEKVLKKIDKIADKFYSGDVTTAFKKAGRLGFDAETLVGVSLSMKSTEITKAISAYQSVGNSTAPVTTPATEPATAGSLPAAAQFAQGVHDVVTDPAAQAVIANPAQSLAKLLQSATQLKNNTGHPAAHSLNDLAQALKAILDAVVNLANSTDPAGVKQEPPQALAA